jgi:TFIIF-interacting CTD phosphatase-like protein
MGDRPYALEMAKLLDPRGEHFNAKVISWDDGTQKHQKGLNIVLGQESVVLILVDTEHVSSLLVSDLFCQLLILKCLFDDSYCMWNSIS